MTLLFGVLWALATLAGDVLGAAWLADRGGLRGLPAALVYIGAIYCCQSVMWVGMMSTGVPMGRGSAIFACLGLGIGVAAGLCFGERLTTPHYAGVACALAAIVLLSR